MGCGPCSSESFRRFAVGVKQILAALLPRCPKLGRRDVPVRAAFPGNGAEVLAEIFKSRTAEEPIAVVDLINHKLGLQNNHVGDHRIVYRIRILGDVEIFLHDTPRV